MKTLISPSKIEKRDIEWLLRYSIEEIESSLVKIFLDKNNLQTQNLFLLEVLDKNHSAIKIEIENYLDTREIILDLKLIERFFELLIEQKDRKINGAFYTPTFIVDYIVNNTITSDEKICDLSCGSGAFLIGATKRIYKITKKPIIEIIEQNLFGSDISQSSIFRSKILLSLLALINKEDKEIIRFNLKITDSLSYDWNKECPEGFDVIVGNPPYIRIQDFDKRTKEFLISKYRTTKKGNFNLYFAFFDLGIALLKEKGKLGYITPNNYFTSLAGKDLREYFQDGKFIKRIINFNHLKIFEDAATYTCITILDKDKKKSFEYTTLHNKEKLADLNKLSFSNVKYSNLDNKKWRLMSEVDYYNIKQIEDTGISLRKFADIKVGIATLKDSLYLIEGNKEYENYYIKRHEGKEYLIEKGITRKIIKIAAANSDEDIRMNDLMIIFPYKRREDKHYLIEENKLKLKFPKAYDYLLSIKKELIKRDKGKIQIWYAYGRKQGLNLYGKKLLTKTFSNKPNFMLDENEYSLFCNGYAIFPKVEKHLKILKKLLNSKLMDYYAKKTSVEIGGAYQCYQKNFIEKFSIPKFNDRDREFLEKEEDKEKVNSFLINIYKLKPVKELVL